MGFKLNSHLSLAKESEEEDNEVITSNAPADSAAANLPVDEAAVAPDSVETQLLDAAEAGGEVEEASDAVDQLTETQDALEALRERVNAIAKNEGGLTPGAARVVSLEMHALVRNKGIKAPYQFSTESFESGSGRIGATNFVLEEIGKTIKATASRVWEAIKAAFRHVIAFLRRLVGLDKSLVERADALLNQLKDHKGTASESEFEDAGIAKALYYKGCNLADGSVVKHMSDFLGAFIGVEEKLTESSKKLIEKANKSEAIPEGDVEALFSPLESVLKNQHEATMCSDPLPGNHVAAIILGTKEANGEKELKSAGITVTAEVKETKVPVLSIEAMRKVAIEIKALAAHITKAEELIKPMEVISKELDNIKPTTATEENKDAVEGMVKVAAKILVQPFTSVVTLSTTVGKHALDHCTASLKHYK